MVKKLLAAAVVLLVMVSGARAEVRLYTAHSSIAGLSDGKSDYSEARFLKFIVNALDFSVTTSSEDAYLKGSMTFSGGSYSFWDGKKGMHKISGTPYTFGAWSLYGAGSGLQYGPLTASGDKAVFCLEADGGLNGVNVSWGFQDKPEYDGQGTIPAYRTTQQQLESYVPYVEYIREGSTVTGLTWRVVNPADVSTPVSQDFEMHINVQAVWSAEGFADNWTLWSNVWDGTRQTYIAPGDTPEGTVLFDDPISEDEIFLIQVTLNCEAEGERGGDYNWYFCKPSEPRVWVFETHGFDASLVNGKSDYSGAKFADVYFCVEAERFVVEAKHFTDKGRITIPGGGYSLGDDSTGRELGITIPAGTDKTYTLRMLRSVAPGDAGAGYQPIYDDGTNLHFTGDADTSLPGRTLTWTFPEEFGFSGSANVSSFKSVSQQLAAAVPYVELVSADGMLTAVNFRFVTVSDTSTALSLPYSTNVRLRFDRLAPEISGRFHSSSWMYNTSSGTWTLKNPQPVSNMEGITFRYWSFENPDNPVQYMWFFSKPAEAPAPLEITTATLPGGVTGSSYTATLAANLPGATWSVSSGTLPSGLTLNPTTGTISGTPTTAGTATFTVTATLAGHDSASKQFTITISATPPATITITTTSLPSGTVNEPYTASLEASVSGATWSVISGNLPSGLNLNSSTGAITGNPTTAGAYTFTVRAVLGTAAAEKALSITVVSQPESDGVRERSSGGCSSFPAILGAGLLAVILKRR